MYFFVEKKKNKKWISCDVWKEDEYYIGCFFVPEEHLACGKPKKELIELLTGYKSKKQPIKQPVGLPRDMSLPVKLIETYEVRRGSMFARNHTFYYLHELIDFFEKKKHSPSFKAYINKHFCFFKRKTLPLLKKIKKEKGVEDVRVIVWVDL